MQTFRDYMEAALYDPERGYYSRRIPTEDFYTAPELHPVFAAVLARHIARKFSALCAAGVAGPYSVVEIGSGSGLLASGILKQLAAEYPLWAQSVRYILVDRSRNSMLASVISLSASHERVIGYSRLEDVLPCCGVLFSNELVDAFPVHLLEKREGEMFEVYIEDSGRTVLSEFSSPQLAAHAAAAAPGLEEGQRHAVNLEALRWLRTASEKLIDGYLITLDYGKRFSGAPNSPRTFYKHSSGDLLTEGKGLKDITASVDFDALISEGRRVGLQLESYGTLANFLLDGGVADWLEERPAQWTCAEGALASFKSRSKIKTLIHPEGMGEAYKALIQKKKRSEPAL